jgi:hypothetical protein
LHQSVKLSSTATPPAFFEGSATATVLIRDAFVSDDGVSSQEPPGVSFIQGTGDPHVKV